jgi:hypothetical protein
MEIAHACQVEVQELVYQEFDLMILGNKMSERCSFLLRNYTIQAQRILVLINNEVEEENRKLNPQLTPFKGLDLIEINPNEGETVVEYIETLANKLNHDELSILIDYSCMSMYWYASIINYLYLKEISCERINIYFAYTPVTYTEPRKQTFKQDLHVILKDPVFVNTEITKKALILGLGYDVERAEFMIQKIKPSTVYYFYSQPSIDERYTEKVLQLNDRLIRTSEPGKLFPFPMSDMDITVELLTKIVFDLRLSHKVILASFGPKLLTLACLLLFARFPDIEILSAGSEQNSVVGDVPINFPVIYKSVFLSDDSCE